MSCKQPLLVALLLASSLSPSAMAAIEITPTTVTVGKEATLQLHGVDASTIQQISLLPGGPHLLQQLPLTPGNHGDYTLISKADGLHLLQQMGPERMEAAHFGNHAAAAHSGNQLLRIENGNQLALYPAQPKQAKPISRYHASAPLHDLVVIGSLAILANDRNGVTVLDISDAKQPRWRGSHQKLGRIIRVVAADDKVLALSDGDVAYLIDIKNPAEPTVINAWRSHTAVHDMVWFDQTLYLKTENSIDIIDFSAPMPQISNEGLNFGQGVNFGGERRVFIANNIAYVADWFSGIHLYDISNPNLPLLLSSFHTPGSPKGMVVRDNIAYVPDDDHGLQIIDVSNPRAPKLISNIQTSGLGYTPRLAGDLLYLASHRGGFQIIDVSNPAKPQQLSEVDTPGKAWSLEIQGERLYVADDDTGLLIFDVKDAKAPKLLGQFTPGTAAEEVMIRGNIAFVAFFDDGIYILDITDPTTPKVISHTALPGNSRGLDLIGDKLYVASWLAGIHILDISNLKTPQVVGSFDTRGATWGLKVEGDNLFAMDWWGGIAVLDVSDPAAVHVVGDYHERGRVNDIATQGNYAFVAQGSNGLQLFDINNPLNPTWITGVNFPGDARRIALANGRAYLAMGDGGLAIADISNPFEARWLSTTPTDGRVVDVIVDQSHLWLLDELQGVLLYEISNPNQPRQLARINLKASAIALTSHGLIVASHDGLHRYGVDATGKVAALGYQPLPGETGPLLAVGNTLYVGQGAQLLQFEVSKTEITLQSERTLSHAIHAIAHAGKTLIVSAEYEVMRLEPTTLKIIEHYPMLNRVNRLRLHEGVLYLSGATTITALRLLPSIHLKEAADGRFTLPATVVPGSYHLYIRYQDGTEQQLNNVVNVVMPTFSKPKMSTDAFKKLLELKRDDPTLFSVPQ